MKRDVYSGLLGRNLSRSRELWKRTWQLGALRSRFRDRINSERSGGGDVNHEHLVGRRFLQPVLRSLSGPLEAAAGQDCEIEIKNLLGIGREAYAGECVAGDDDDYRIHSQVFYRRGEGHRDINAIGAGEQERFSR